MMYLKIKKERDCHFAQDDCYLNAITGFVRSCVILRNQGVCRTFDLIQLSLQPVDTIRLQITIGFSVLF